MPLLSLSRCCPLISLALVLLCPVAGRAQPATAASPQAFSLPSPEPSGDAMVDQVWIDWYPAARPADSSVPAVVLLHPLGGDPTHLAPRFARYLAGRGTAVALMVLPYHTRRARPGEEPVDTFASPDTGRVAQAMSQAAADAGAVVTWLSRQPGVDAQRIGIVGISLGAVIAHLAMGQDARLTAGVALLGGGDLASLRRRSLVFRLRHREARAASRDPAVAEALRRVDPLTYAGRNRPRRVLMVEAARDLLVPPDNARALWEALGRPPIRWVDTNHFGIGLAPRSVMKASADYLHSVWSSPSTPTTPPRIHALTLKLGTIVALDSTLTPALQWQALSFARRRDQMSLLHADLGWTGRGPFLGLAVTLNPFVDLGIARRFNGESVRPYLSLHVVF